MIRLVRKHPKERVIKRKKIEKIELHVLVLTWESSGERFSPFRRAPVKIFDMNEMIRIASFGRRKEEVKLWM